MSRFYVRPEDVKGDKIYIGGGEAHHIIDVMRLKAGDEISAFDAKGNEYIGAISRTGKKSVTVDIKERRAPAEAQDYKIALAQAIPKGGTMDYIVEKCTELGIDSIIPIVTERTIVQIDSERKEHKCSRWRRLSIEASKQCGRARLPEIKDISGFEEALSEMGKYDLALIPHLGNDTKRLPDVLADSNKKSAIIFIGPEGDFTKPEVERAVARGAIPINLGPNVLRCDTAAITALSIVSYEFSKSSSPRSP